MADPPGCCRSCATCLLCLYSCQWITAKKEKRKGLRTTKCDYSWFLFLFCVFLFTLVWLYFAIIILNDFHNFNEFIFKQRKLWLDWSLLLLIATAVLITYSAVLLVLALCLQLCGQPLKLHWLHKVRDWWCREMVPGLAALAPWEAVTSLLGLRMAAVTPLSGCVSPLSWAAAVSAPATLLWDGNIPLAQSMRFRAQLQTQMGEVGSQALQGLRRKGRGGFCLPCQGRAQLACRMLCAPLTALCPAPQTLLILTALVVAAAFIGLGIKWAEEWRSARVSLQATGPFLHIGIVGGMTLLAWPLASFIYRTHNTGLKVFLLLVYCTVMIALYLAPLGITSPCIMEENQLPPKPALVGHRGAPMLAPENTLMSLYKAVDCDVQVFETDVMVSADGVPFLMHDEELTRTTNVQAVFPERAALNSTAFNWTDLQQLDAGSWFLERRPFPTVQSLSAGDRYQVTEQRIPSLEQALEAAKQSNISIMFDLRPENHSDYQSFVNATLEVILQSGIPLQQVLWLPDGFREQVKQQAPGIQQVYGRKRLQNEKESLLHVNLPYQDMSSEEIRQYRQDNISVNLYVVNQPWLFSVLWCSGVSSVTTNACQVLKEMKHPIWLLVSDPSILHPAPQPCAPAICGSLSAAALGSQLPGGWLLPSAVLAWEHVTLQKGLLAQQAGLCHQHTTPGWCSWLVLLPCSPAARIS
ncbi:glycerophosphoinositol inositolphosphodiesterase GDPD2 isoform 2-T4 [Morphnus guianensis]